jgi:hypothetical protein
MKKILILLSLLLLISLWTNYYFLSIKNNNLKSNSVNIKVINKDLQKVSKWGIKEKRTKNIGKIDLEYECDNVIKWKKSSFIEKTELFNFYLKAKDIKNIKYSNTYLDFVNIKKWNCKYFKGSRNGKICILIKNKDIDWIDKKIEKWSYENILIKSFSLNKNLCNEIIKEKESKECNIYYNHYFNMGKKTKDILWWSSFNIFKSFSNLGEKHYFEELDKEFLQKCIKL